MQTEKQKTCQFLVTIPAGKRLIAKAVTSLKQVQKALNDHTIVIVAGTTNGYIAEELLAQIGQSEGFSKKSFFRGVTVAPGKKINPDNNAGAHGDVVIEKGSWVKGKTIFDAAPSLGKGDIILKGANAVDTARQFAGILIGNPTIGTSGPILQAVLGKRTELIIPVGLEKRVFGSIGQTAAKLNAPYNAGLRMLPVNGTIVTELEAIEELSGGSAELIAGGGICGAEGSCWIAVTGTDAQLDSAAQILRSIGSEPSFQYE